MVPKTCSIPDCTKNVKARGWCGAHWWRWSTHGDPLGAVYQPKACLVEGCETTSISLGWCSPHYQRFRKWGDPTAGFPSPNQFTDEDRLWQKVIKKDGCWAWRGGHHPKGYATFTLNGQSMHASRAIWMFTNGPIPEDIQVDHRCRNTRCVRPDHLRLATNKQNGENKGVFASNTSGYRGVSYFKPARKWRAEVTHHKSRYYLGLFSTAEAAGRAATAKRLELFTYNEEDRKVS